MRLVNEMFAVVFVHPEQGEGIPAVRDSLGWVHILADSNPAKVRELMPEIRRMARDAGMPFKVLRFSGREDVTSQFEG